MMQEES